MIAENRVILPYSTRVWQRRQTLQKGAKNHYLMIHRHVIDVFLFAHYARLSEDKGGDILLNRVWKYLRDTDHENLVDPDQTVEDAQLLFYALLKSYTEHDIPRQQPDIVLRQCRYDNNGLFLTYFDYDGYDIPF